MSDTLKKVQPSHKLRMPAAAYNAFIDTTMELRRRQQSQQQSATPKSRQSGISGRKVQFAAVTGLSVSAGDVYRIGKPQYNLNRSKGKTLKLIVPANGNTHEVT